MPIRRLCRRCRDGPGHGRARAVTDGIIRGFGSEVLEEFQERVRGLLAFLPAAGKPAWRRPAPRFALRIRGLSRSSLRSSGSQQVSAARPPGLEDPPDLFIGAGGLVGKVDGVGAEHRVDAGIGQSRPWSGPTALRSDWEPRSGQRIGTRRGRSRPAFRRAPSGSTAMAASTLWSIRRREALRLRPGVRRRGTQGRVRAAGHHRLARLAEVCAAARRLSDAREILGHDQPQDEPGRGRPGGRDAGFGGRVRRGG